MRLAIYLFLFFVLSSSCNDESKNEDVNKTFFPIEGNIKAELKALDSMPVAILKYTTEGQLSDTALIDKATFRKVAEMLYTPDISSPGLKKFYKESVFMDNTINTVTMSYTTTEQEPVVRKIEVTIQPESENVRSIYVEKQEGPVVAKMIWTPGKNLQVITITNKAGEAERIKTEKYTWE